MSAIVTLALKDLKQLLRDRMGTFWIIVFPVIMALFFGAIFGGGRGGSAGRMSILIVDEDGTDASRGFAARLARMEALSVVTADRASARESVRLGKKSAFVVIPRGFGEASPLFGAGKPAQVQVGMDPSRKAEAGYLQGLLLQASFEGMQDVLRDPQKVRPYLSESLGEIEGGKSGLPPEQQENLSTFLRSLDGFLGRVDSKAYGEKGPRFEPLQIESIPVTAQRAGPHSPYEISFPQGILWALIACSTSFALALVRERMQGTFLRLRAAPLSRAQILAGKGLACFLAAMTVISVLLLLGRVACGIRLEHPLLLALAIPCSAACFVGIMLFVSVLGKTDRAVSGGGWALLMIFSMLGGGTVPLFIMPDWMKTMGSVSPAKWAILALEGAIWRDFTVSEMLLPCVLLLAFGALFAVLGLVRFARLERI
jgi:ABC-2 type transport system permease protein